MRVTVADTDATLRLYRDQGWARMTASTFRTTLALANGSARPTRLVACHRSHRLLGPPECSILSLSGAGSLCLRGARANATLGLAKRSGIPSARSSASGAGSLVYLARSRPACAHSSTIAMNRFTLSFPITYGCGSPGLRVASAGSLVFDPSKLV